MRISFTGVSISDDPTYECRNAETGELLGDIEHWPDTRDWVAANFGNELDGMTRGSFGSMGLAVLRHYGAQRAQ